MTRITQNKPAGAIRYGAIYTRVSTTDQGEKYSPATQLKRNQENAQKEGFTILPEHIFQDQHTGKKIKRPAFERLRALAQTGAIEGIFILCVDRYARNLRDALNVLQELEELKVRIFFHEMPWFDMSSATSRFSFQQLASVAEFMGHKILEDSARGRMQKLDQGKMPGGHVRYGYVYMPDATWALDEATLPANSLGLKTKPDVVRQAYQWRKGGMATFSIMRKLNDAGILSQGCGKHPPGLWGRKTVLQMLKGKTYTGEWTSKDRTIEVPRIIEPALWQAVQDAMAQARVKDQGRPSKQYLLVRYLWCGKCGKRCISKSAGKDRPAYYRCSALDREHNHTCDGARVPALKVENAAWGALWNHIKDPDRMLRMGQAYYDALSDPGQKKVAGLQKEYRKLENAIESTQNMMREGLMQFEKGAALIRADQGRMKEIQVALSAAGKVITLPPLEAIQATSREITQGPEPSTYERRRSILDGLVNLHIKYLGGKLRISGAVALQVTQNKAGRQKNCHSREGDGGSSLEVPFSLEVKVA